MARKYSGLTLEIAQALDAAGYQSWRGGDIRGRSGYVLDQVGPNWVKVRWNGGPDDWGVCTDWLRRTQYPMLAESLRAAGFESSVTCTQLAGEWVNAGAKN